MLNTRRRFLQWLPSLPLLSFLAPPAIAQPAPHKLLMNQFRVAGLAYYEVEAVIQRIQPGDTLRLIAEPTNPHDPFAVEIWHGAKNSVTFPAEITGISAGCCDKARPWPAKCGKPTRTRRCGRWFKPRFT